MAMRSIFLGLAAVCLTVAPAWAEPRFPVRTQPQPPHKTATLEGQAIRYQVRDGHAVIDGDILLAPAAELEAAALDPKRPLPRSAAQVLTPGGLPMLWPEGVMYYSIAPQVPNQQRILDAIETWNARTPLKVLPRTAQTNYVEFVNSSGGGCSSYLGMIGGVQQIFLGNAANCPTVAVVHEIGHAFGLLHEQSRMDRNRNLTVLYENIDTANYFNFQQRNPSRDWGYYDFGSVMHYSSYGFSLDFNASIETVPRGIPIGQRSGLSPADIDGVSRMYGFQPTQTTVTTIPEGLSIVVDGERYTSPRSFNWAAGTTHVISTDTTQNSGLSGNPTLNRLVRWTDNGAATHSFTANPSQMSVVAAVFQQSFRVSAAIASGSGTVTLEPASPDGYYVGGTMVRVTARPANGFQFYRWLGTDPEFFGYGLAAETLSIDVRAPMSFGGQFTNQPMVAIESDQPGAIVDIDGVPYFTPARFLSFVTGASHTLSVEPAQYDYLGATRLNFQGWEDGSLSTQRTIPPGEAVYSARFTKQNYFYYDWTNDGFVTVSPQGDDYYDQDAPVTISAVPRPARALQYWLGDVVSGEATQTIVMNRPKFVVGVFGEPIPFRATNAATYTSNPSFDQPGTYVAPLEIVTLLGRNLGPGTLAGGALDSNGRLSTIAGDTRVYFDGVPAPVVYASDLQTSVIVPAEVANRAFTVITVERGGAVTAINTASVIPAHPGVFTANQAGTGPIAAFNQDYSLNGPDRPAEAGSVVTLYATGGGLMDATLPNGAVTDSNLLRPRLPVSVRIGTEDAEIVYAGSAPTLVHGVLQVNVKIPFTVLPGNQPLRLVIGNYSTPPGATVSIR